MNNWRMRNSDEAGLVLKILPIELYNFGVLTWTISRCDGFKVNFERFEGLSAVS
jgi:hypothetical protein